MNSSDSDICAGPRKSREAQKHFGAAGRPGSHVKPFTRSRFASQLISLSIKMIRLLQGPQVRDCPWSSRVQGLQEVDYLLHICALFCPCNSVHSRLPPIGFKDSSTMLNLSEFDNV